MSLDITTAEFESGIPKWVSWAAIAVFIVTTVVVYGMLFGIYRPHNIDDPWYLSFAFNWFHLNSHRDLTFGGDFGGVRLFGKTYAIIYGTLAGGLGWTKAASHVISILIGGASLPFWFASMKRLGLSDGAVITWVLLLVWLEPFYGAANQARPDILVFLLIGVVMYFYLNGRIFFALLLAGVAFEVHPSGILSYVVMTALFVSGVRPKDYLSAPDYRAAAYGFFAGVTYYLSLHVGNLGLVIEAVTTGSGRGVSAHAYSLYDAYFINTTFMRHLPELVIIVVSTGLFFRIGGLRRYRPLAFLLIVIGAAGAFIRPNFHYMVFLYPFLLIPVVVVADEYRRLTTLLLGFLLLLAPQYAIVYAMNRDYSLNEYIALAKATVPDDELPVAGDANGWYAFKERPYYHLDYDGEFLNLGITQFYMIEDEAYRSGEYRLDGRIEESYRREFIGTFAYDGEVHAVFRMIRKGQQSAPHGIPSRTPFS